MSAPPIGSVIVMPSTSASTKNALTTAGRALTPLATMAPSTIAPPRIRMLRNCWPPKRNERLISPCSLPKAMPEPREGHRADQPAEHRERAVGDAVEVALVSSTAAIAAAAPPPMPL